VAQQLKKCLFTNGLALTLQNGLGNDILLAQELGSQRVAVGITTLGATLVSPGKVNTFDQGEITLQAGPNIHEIKSILDSAAFTTNMDASIDCIIWGKLVVNSAINPLTALLEIPNGMLLELPSAMDLMEQITREAVQTAAQINITLPYANPMQQVKTVISATASNYSSMYQDILRGAPTEIDQINGAILNLAQENGLKLPYNQSITALIKAKVIKNSLRIQ
jgi:2-dehydropantoate 2-reductase